MNADSRERFTLSICGPRPPCNPPKYKHTHFDFVCLSHVRTHTHTQASADGGGVGCGVRGFAPASPSSAHWLSGPSEESDNTLMTGRHLLRQLREKVVGVAKYSQGATNPPPPHPMHPSPNPNPFFLSSSIVFLFSNHVTPHATHLLHIGAFTGLLFFLLFCDLSGPCLIAEGHKGLPNNALKKLANHV